MQKKEARKIGSKGFSLIELVVVLGIFLLVMGVAVDIFISVVGNQKRILAQQELLSQTSYVIGYMSDSLRMAKKDPDGSCLGQTGYVYVLTHCADASQECQGVKFINSQDNNACEEFFLDNTQDASKSVIKEIKNGLPAQDLLSDAFQVKYAKFVINADASVRIAGSNDIHAPRITVVMDIASQGKLHPQEKIVQTTVAQRQYP